MKLIKQVVVLLTLTLFTTFTAFGEDGVYEKAMAKAIETLYTTKQVDELIPVANQFNLIARKETSQWLPLYYEALSYLWLAGRSKNAAKQSGYLNQAQAVLDKAQTLKPNDSELVTLQGYLYMITVASDPATYGPTLAGKAIGTLQKAHQLNPENPRAMLLLGQMQIGTAQYMGGSTTEPCELVAKSRSFFAKEQGQTDLMPRWGQSMVGKVIEGCGR
ncbi:hypothetical protein GCM10023189_58440 [Nibrella saemangeumensis]|uniref:Tetratricopeptide repeat-containing protein n=1 Tax=Nibrella saemangeumensis TaxID=1084526 RepID=A0ABP8NSN0_9BACT